MRFAGPIIASLAVCLWIGVAIAATPAPSANRVVMLLRDGTSIGGEFVEATPAGVTIRPSPKTPPVTKPWAEIKQLGNGMTRESIVAQWRTTQRELLCDTCVGDATTACDACGGKGVASATAAACAKCDGTGTIGKCKTPRCVDGKIPCPNPCLKPSDFRGTPDKDGKRWKRFPGKGGGVATWSDAHIGQVIVTENGVPTNKGVCPRCDGNSVISDPACHGTGDQTCDACKGKSLVGAACATCKDGIVPCATCGATGLKAATTRPLAVKDES